MGKNKSSKSKLSATKKEDKLPKEEIHKKDNEDQEEIHYEGNWIMVFLNIGIALFVLYVVYKTLMGLKTGNDYWLLLQKIGRFLIGLVLGV